MSRFAPERAAAPPAPASRMSRTGFWHGVALSPAGVFLILLLLLLWTRGGEAASPLETLSLSIRPVAMEIQNPVAITHAGDGSAWVARELIDTPPSITAFGEGEDGELYVAHRKWGGAGAIYRISAGP